MLSAEVQAGVDHQSNAKEVYCLYQNREDFAPLLFNRGLAWLMVYLGDN